MASWSLSGQNGLEQPCFADQPPQRSAPAERGCSQATGLGQACHLRLPAGPGWLDDLDSSRGDNGLGLDGDVPLIALPVADGELNG